MVAIIAKVTEAFNSHCAYCDVVTKPHQQTATMTGAVLECLYRRVNDYLAEDRSRSCEIVWHGGEPLLAGVDFYTTAAELCERLCPTTRNRINHCLQTNLTQLTGDFIALRFHRFAISSPPPPAGHHLGRHQLRPDHRHPGAGPRAAAVGRVQPSVHAGRAHPGAGGIWLGTDLCRDPAESG